MGKQEFHIPDSGWIWLRDWRKRDGDKPVLAYFRKKFMIKDKPDAYRILVSADSRYKLYINGSLVQVGPVKGDRWVWYRDSVDIAGFLREGENVLAAEVLVYGRTGGNHGIFRTETPGLYVQDPNTGGANLSADGSYRCRVEEGFTIVPESLFFAPLMILEDRRGNPENAGWKLPGYQDDAWEAAAPYNFMEISRACVPGDLTDRTIPFLYRKGASFAGVKKIRKSSRTEAEWNAFLAGDGALEIAPHTEEIVEIDAGEEMTGYLSLRMQGGSGGKIEILTAEAYAAPMDAQQAAQRFPHPLKTDRSDAENGVLCGFTDTYHAAGYGRDGLEETYAPFWFRTFRYIQMKITTEEQMLRLTGFDYEETGYPLETHTKVETSDESLAAIWDISLRSLRRCMHETYEDCPFYEQLQYAMDSRSQILYTYAVSGDDRLARKCMDDFRRSQRSDGMINCSYPTNRPNVIPGFSIYYILMLKDHMMYFGDKEFLRMHLPAVDGILEYFRRHLDGCGLVGRTGGRNGIDRYWSFIDWTTQWNATSGAPDAVLSGPITMESFLYILGLSAAAKILRFLGRDGTAGEYEDRAQAVRKAINQYCRSANGMYQDGPGIDKISQHCQVFALLTDTVGAEEGAKYLEETLEKKEAYAQCSVAMAFYLFRALEKAGMYEQMDACWNLWRDMVRNHLTTCVEDNVNQRSDCHAWGAAILYELPAVTLGVEPGAPGYAKIRIAPVCGYLDWARGDVVTRWGNVHVEWKKKQDGTLDLSWQAPEGIPVELGKE